MNSYMEWIEGAILTAVLFILAAIASMLFFAIISDGSDYLKEYFRKRKEKRN